MVTLSIRPVAHLRRIAPIAPFASRRTHLGLLATARVTLGAAALAHPTAALRATGVDRVTAERTAWTAQLLGGRDLALGAGLLHALATGQPTTGWVLASALADTVDTAAITTAAARGRISPAAGALAALLAAGAAAWAIPALTTRPDTPAAAD